MAGLQRVYKQRIRSTETLAKVFRAMELIAASRIGAARDAASSANPFDRAITHAVAALTQHSTIEHPMTCERTDTKRVAILAVTADRGMAGAYSASILRACDDLVERLRESGREPELYVAGRRARSYYSYRGIEVAGAWEGESDRPSEQMSDDIARTLTDRFMAPAEDGGIAEVYVLYTRFHNMVKQVPEIRKVLPLKVVDDTDRDYLLDEGLIPESVPERIMPLYEFEPSPEVVLDMLLPMYVRSRIRNALLQSAASELASRQTAMHTANDNAHEMIATYTRLANAARQAEITTEITEIVSGADALSGS
ncbi:F0F1 ATP synthase subunit gamma [Nanchangia anserum]|uniref:ATP synthase gamma chain n=1 Tax=Nanchangia anserum TaxID=2692125 RepID=A0A8I0KUP9_9ACTO|nr:F0F1 ATP synthase subunit gamma [Nanchangia anserum]MBD3689933.1 F0F1 ATP synthase subunit gamma [Nanchangia anserum]